MWNSDFSSVLPEGWESKENIKVAAFESKISRPLIPSMGQVAAAPDGLLHRPLL